MRLGILLQNGVERVHHYAPLHYLPFIARSRSLMSKISLRQAGFQLSHLRSKSHRSDVTRGFGSYTHLTVKENPPILLAKLSAGFPHVALSVPTEAVERCDFSLCRFNVAMTRRLRRGAKAGFPESPTNGRYYNGHEIPIARSDADKAAMLRRHLHDGTMIEVLIHGDLPLLGDTAIRCFSRIDAEVVTEVLRAAQVAWSVQRENPPGIYPETVRYRRLVSNFIAQAMSDPAWRGNGLEFDRV